MSGIGKTGGARGGREIEQADDAPETAASPTQADPSQSAPAAPGRGGRAAATQASSDMLRQSLEAKLRPDGSSGKRGKASTLPSGRDVIHGPAVFAAERRRDPSATEKFLSGAPYDQKQLLDEARSAARYLDLKIENSGSTSVESDGGHARAWASGSSRLDADGFTAQGRARAEVGARGEASGSFESEMLSANARIRAEAMIYADAEGNVRIDQNGLSARGSAEVGVRVRVDVDASFRTGGVRIGGERLDVNGQIHAEAEVSAYARVDADVAATMEPPRVVVVANAKAFAGAKAAAHGSIGLGDFIKVTGSAEAWAGAGAEAGITAGYDDGKLRLGFNLGAAVGVGAGLSFGIEIDLKKIGSAIANFFTGGKLDISVLLDHAGYKAPIQIAQLELLFPPEFLESLGAAASGTADLATNEVRIQERKREAAAAERRVQEMVKASATGR